MFGIKNRDINIRYMFIIDALIYVFFAIVMTILAKKSNQLTPQRYGNKIKLNSYLIFYVIFFIVVCAIRYDVGVDSINYAKYFKYGIPENTLEDRSSEFLWVNFVNTVRYLNLHFTIGMGIIAFLQIYFLIKGIKKFNYLLVSIPIVLFAGKFYPSLMNGMRQMLVACAFIYILKWIVERKFWHYLIFLWIAHYVHNSALMLIPLYFIPVKFTLADKKKLCLIIFMICFILGQTPAFKGFASFIEGYVTFFGYDDYMSSITNKLNNKDEAETMAFGITMISYFLMSLFVIIFSKKLRQRYKDENPYFDLWYNYSFLYSCGFFLFCNISHIFLRPFAYFELFLMIMLALTINYCYEKRNKQLVKKIPNKYINYSLIIIIWIGLFWTLFRISSSNERESISYKTIFNHTI